VRIVKALFIVIVFLLLSLLTQVGGLVYLLSFFTYPLISRRVKNQYFRGILKFGSFLILYLSTTFLIVPLIAKPFGREQLPITQKNNIKPLTIFTCLLNRNYVRAELKESVFRVANEMNQRFPETTLNYLDANFPFFNGFPLMPHLSHNDGKKLDIAFCYRDKKTNQQTNKCPSFIGYGIGETPLPGETNTASSCAGKGHWQYSFLQKIIPQGSKQNFIFDNIKTRELVNLFASQRPIEKIFIEPHLKTRLKLSSDKIRFHGCQAVRHDDHIHVQLR
jgi:hypothetical protein